MIDHTLVKLGRRPKKTDTRTLRLLDYLEPQPPGFPAPPPVRSWSSAVAPHVGTMLNNRLGTCVLATLGHMIQVWTANHGREVTISDADIMTAYCAVGKYVIGDPSTDQGCVMLDALKYARKEGIGGHKLGVFLAVDPRNQLEVDAAINLGGGIAVGWNLPLSAQGQPTWRVPWYGPHLRGRPGSWGPHATWTADYSTPDQTLRCYTWGELQRATFGFGRAYIDEAYATFGSDWCDEGYPAPNGLKREELLADLEFVTRL